MIEWLGSIAGRLVVGGSIIASIVAGVLVFEKHFEAVGAANVISDSKVEGKKINAKNEKVRARSNEPGAAERLQQHDCRDCR